MYGFGDDVQPYSESVDLLEDLVVQYITDMVCIDIRFIFTIIFCFF